jgi:hypothetical protein
MTVRRLNALTLAFALAVGALALLFGSVRAAPASQSVFFVAPHGQSGACSQSQPCSFVIASIEASSGDTIYLEQGTYTSTFASVIQVSQGYTLSGGWSGNPSGQPVINPALNPTIIDGQNSRRGIVITSGITPTIEGLVIENGNASGQTTDCSTLFSGIGGCGGGIFVDNAAAQILNNKFISNTALVTNDKTMAGYGGGLYLVGADGAVISGNVFLSNTAALPSAQIQGIGGGLAATGYNPNLLLIQNNTFMGNSAYWGGGLGLEGADHTQVQGNLFENNSAKLGGGIYIWESTAGAGGNTLRGNSGDSAAYLGYFNGPFGNNLLVDNLTTDAGIVLFDGYPNQSALLYNNVLGDNGGAGIDASGYISFPLTVIALNNTLVGSGAGTGLLLSDGYVTATAVDTLLSGFTTGVHVTYPGTSTAVLTSTLFDTNVAVTGNASFSGNVFGPAAFLNPAQRNYHLLFNSAARDAGTTTILTTDFDGNPRSAGEPYDIGAFEEHVLFLPLARR